MAWHNWNRTPKITHQLWTGIPQSLKWVGLSTFLLVMPGGLILWGAQAVVRWKRDRAKPSCQSAMATHLEPKPETTIHAGLEKKAIPA